MDTTNQLSRRGAVLMGVAFISGGIFPILIGTGGIARSDGDAPGWVALAAGAMFVCAGAAVILDYGVANGIAPDGDFTPGTPLWIRGANLALGLAIVGLMALVAGCIAFGSGPRHFTSTLTIPFLPQRWQSGELSGRIAFGAASVLLVLMFIVCGVSGVRRLQRGIITKRP